MRAQRIDTPPDGFRLEPEFVSPDEERKVLAAIATRSFRDVVMHGVVAKRRVLHFGWTYGYETWRIAPGEPIPPWLAPLRDRAAALGSVDPAALGQALVSEYPPGAGIGWHRDAPMFGPVVIGISLAAPCRFQLRRTFEGAPRVFEAELAPRSAYVLAGEARRAWQHHVPPVRALRYSITFRTVLDPARWTAAGALVE